MDQIQNVMFAVEKENIYQNERDWGGEMSTWTLLLLMWPRYEYNPSAVTFPGFKSAAMCKEQGDRLKRNTQEIRNATTVCVEIK